MGLPIDMMMLKNFDQEHHSPPEYISNLRNNTDHLNYISLQNKRENQLRMKETYDRKVTRFRFYEGQRCYLYDPVAKVGECFKLRMKWRGSFLINNISSHNVFLYHPSTDKYIEKSVHINRIKPCYQRDDMPEDDENIEDFPIVEVTYPRTKQTPTTSATNQQTNGTQNPVQDHKNRASNDMHTTPDTHAPREVQWRTNQL